VWTHVARIGDPVAVLVVVERGATGVDRHAAVAFAGVVTITATIAVTDDGRLEPEELVAAGAGERDHEPAGDGPHRRERTTPGRGCR